MAYYYNYAEKKFKLHTYFESWVINTNIWLQVRLELVYPLVPALYIQAIKTFVKCGDKLLCLFSTRIAEVSKQICYRFAQYLNKSVCEYKDVWCNITNCIPWQPQGCAYMTCVCVCVCVCMCIECVRTYKCKEILLGQQYLLAFASMKSTIDVLASILEQESGLVIGMTLQWVSQSCFHSIFFPVHLYIPKKKKKYI